MLKSLNKITIKSIPIPRSPSTLWCDTFFSFTSSHLSIWFHSQYIAGETLEFWFLNIIWMLFSMGLYCLYVAIDTDSFSSWAEQNEAKGYKIVWNKIVSFYNFYVHPKDSFYWLWVWRKKDVIVCSKLLMYASILVLYIYFW